jgi:hypothetical protein
MTDDHTPASQQAPTSAAIAHRPHPGAVMTDDRTPTSRQAPTSAAIAVVPNQGAS